MSEKDALKISSVLSEGYGIIPKKVMKDKDLSIEAKSIYAFLCSYSGKGDTAFPGVSLITGTLGISRQRYNKHREILEKKGYITVIRERTKDGKLGRNVYKINMAQPTLQKPTLDSPSLDEPTLDNLTNNNNIPNNNSINNNKETLALFESWYDLYNKKKSRPKAETAFNKVIKKHDYQTIEKGTIDYLKSIDDKQFQSYPAKFLNQEQYMDDHEYNSNNIFENKNQSPSESLSYLDRL